MVDEAELDVLVPVLVPEVEVKTVDSDSVSEVCCSEAEAMPEGVIPELVIVVEGLAADDIGPPGFTLVDVALDMRPPGLVEVDDTAVAEDIKPPGLLEDIVVEGEADDRGPPGCTDPVGEMQMRRGTP